ncbi:putative copper-binding protein, partial [Vibrio parahaemolyticus V-223/04]
ECQQWVCQRMGRNRIKSSM